MHSQNSLTPSYHALVPGEGRDGVTQGRDRQADEQGSRKRIKIIVDVAKQGTDAGQRSRCKLVVHKPEVRGHSVQHHTDVVIAAHSGVM